MSQYKSIDRVLKKSRLELQEKRIEKKFNNNSNSNSDNNVKTETQRNRTINKKLSQKEIDTINRNRKQFQNLQQNKDSGISQLNIKNNPNQQPIKRPKTGRGTVKMGRQLNIFTGKPELEKSKVKYTTKPKPKVSQTPVELSGPLFDQQPTKKGFKSFLKSPAYYARQRAKTDAGRKRYDFVPDKDGKFDFRPETKKKNIEKYARRMLSRKQIDSKSNVPIKLTAADLAKAERDARSKYGGIDMKKARKKYTRNTFRQGQKEFEKMFKTIRTGEGGTGEPDPFTNRRRKVYTPPKPELEKINPRTRTGTTTTTTPIGSQRVIKKVSQKELEKLTRTVRTPVGSKFGDALKKNQTLTKIPEKEIIKKYTLTRNTNLLNKGFKTGTQGLLKPNKFARIMSKIPKAGKVGLAIGGAALLYTALKGDKKSKNPGGGPIALPPPPKNTFKNYTVSLGLGSKKKEMPTASNPTANTTRLNSITNQALLAKQNRNS